MRPLRYSRGADDGLVIPAAAGRTTGSPRAPTARLPAIPQVPAAQDSGGCGSALRGSTVQVVRRISSFRHHQSHRDTSTVVKPLCQSTASETANVHHPTGQLYLSFNLELFTLAIISYFTSLLSTCFGKLIFKKTRSSADAEKPRDALYYSLF